MVYMMNYEIKNSDEKIFILKNHSNKIKLRDLTDTTNYYDWDRELEKDNLLYVKIDEGNYNFEIYDKDYYSIIDIIIMG